jgi:serine/threonine-protein kinase
VVLVGSCWVTSIAVAEEPVPPARALFDEGRQLAAAGNYAAACPKFEESLRLEVGVGTQFNLANCWEHIGRVASAQALFLGAAASAKASGQLDREQVLRERAAALEPRLSRLVIEVADSDPKLIVKRDDLPLEREKLGTAVVVDPGTYVIVAKAPGKKTWTKSVQVSAQSKVVTVEVPQLEAVEPAAPVATKKPEAAKATPKRVVPAEPASDRARALPPYKALVLGGAGVVGLGLGTIFALRFKSANDDAKDICPSSRDCSVKEIQEHDRLVEKAKNARPWMYASYGLGVAALGGAAAVYFFENRSASKPATTARAPRSIRALPLVAEDGTLGAGLSGEF